MSLKTTPSRVAALGLIILVCVGSLVVRGIEVKKLRSFTCEGTVTSVSRSDDMKKIIIEIQKTDNTRITIESGNIYLDEHKIHVGDSFKKDPGSPGCLVDGQAYRFCD